MNRNWTNDTQKLLGDARCNAPKGLLSDIKKEMARRGVQPAYGELRARVVSLRVRRWGAVAATAAVLVGIGIVLMPRNSQTSLRRVAMDAHRAPSLRLAPHAAEVDASPMASGLRASVAATARRWAERVRVTASQVGMMRRESSIGLPEATDGLQVAVASVTSEQLSDRTAYSGDTPQPSQDIASKAADAKTSRDGVAQEDLVAWNRQAAAHDSRPVQVAAHVAGMPSLNLYGVAGDQYMQQYDAALFGPNASEQGSSVLSGLGHAKVAGMKAKHCQPIRVGVSLRVPIGLRWSLQTGVDYAYLKSEFKDVVRPSDVVGSQSLHYIGVPVSVSYDVWSTRRLNVYASAGGEVEQLVKGTYKSDAGEERVKENRPVVSVNAAAGAAFKLSQSVSVYAEPGLSFHFKNGSGVESAYTDRPLGFSLNVGLRWNTK